MSIMQKFSFVKPQVSKEVVQGWGFIYLRTANIKTKEKDCDAVIMRGEDIYENTSRKSPKWNQL